MTDLQKQLIEICEGLKKRKFEPCMVFLKPPENDWIHGVARLLYIIDGEYHISFTGEDNAVQQLVVPAGTALYCAPYAMLHSDNMLCQNVGISFNFHKEYIRVTHITIDGIHPPPTERDIFYHTSKPICDSGRKIMELVENHARSGKYHDCNEALFALLLHFTVENIIESDPEPVKRPTGIWMEINEYLHQNYHHDLSRETVAKHFSISKSYLSTLCSRYIGTDFTEVITIYRLEHAAMLLENTLLTVDEIAERCGFHYTSYFIRRFKKHYDTTPLTYRNKVKNKRHGL